MSIDTLGSPAEDELATMSPIVKAGIVRLVDDKHSVGTGFVIAPHVVLTCAHVVKAAWALAIDIAADDTPSGEGPRRAGRQIEISRVEHSMSPIDGSPDDFALVHTVQALGVEPLAFVAPLTPAHLERWSGHLRTEGFRGHSGAFGEATGLRVTGAAWKMGRSLPRTMQLDAGIPAGLSGAPVLVGDGPEVGVVGMLRLGGEGHSRSLFYAAPVLIEFAQARGLDVSTCPGPSASAQARDERRWSTVLISHSSADEALALNLRGRLQLLGFHAELVDYRKLGEAPGYSLPGARALVAFCSAHANASRSPALELSRFARTGKPIVLLRLDEEPLPRSIEAHRLIDFRPAIDRERAFAELCARLDETGRGGTAWSEPRSPYPGLTHFEESDGAVFFGRENAIEEALTRLGELRATGASRWLILLGASGTGKSSLLRAGLLPRLRQDSRWVVLGPLQPGFDRIEALARAIADGLAELGQSLAWTKISEALLCPEPASFRDLLARARLASGRPEAELLLVIDPLEELLVPDAGGHELVDARRFLDLLRRWTDRTWGGGLVIGTLRSDFLGAFQASAELQNAGGAPPRHVIVPPLTHPDLRRVIEGPAELANIPIEPGFVDQILADATTEDMLPLLAFTLRELYDSVMSRPEARVCELSCQAYAAMGGLRGAIAKAANRVWESEVERLSDVGREQLRCALLSLVRLKDRQQETRCRVRWKQLIRGDATSSKFPAGETSPIHRSLGALVRARLLVSDGDLAAPRAEREPTLEVAHEALFREWPRFARWISDAKGFLEWRRRLDGSLERWRDHGLNTSPLRGPELAEAEAWLEREPLLVSDEERAFVAFSLREKQRMLAAEKRRTRRLRGLGLGAFLALAVLASWALAERGQATVSAARASSAATHASDTAKIALARLQADPTEGALVLREVRAPAVLPALWLQSAMQTLMEPIAYQVLRGHSGELMKGSFCGDGSSVVTASTDGTARVWNLAGSVEPIVLDPHNGALADARCDPQGRHVVTVASGNTAKLWNADGSGDPLVLEGHQGIVRAALFTPDGRKVVTLSDDQTARIWDAATGAASGVLRGRGGPLGSGFVRADGSKLLAICGGHDVCVWNLESPGVATLLSGHARGIETAAFSPDGRRIVTSSYDSTARIWDADGAGPPVVLRGHDSGVVCANFSPDAQRVVTSSSDASVRIWSADGRGEPIVLRGHDNLVNFVEFSPDGKYVVSASQDKTARLWNSDGSGRPLVLRGHRGRVMTAVFSPDGGSVLTASMDGTARLWPVRRPAQPTVLDGHRGAIRAASFSADGQQVLTNGSDDSVIIWKTAPISSAVLRGHQRRVLHGASLNPAGNLVVTATDDNTVYLWPTDGSGRIALEGHRMVVRSAEFSTDGHTIVTASDDGTAIVWSGDGMGRSVVLRAPDGALTFALPSATGRYFVAQSGAGTAWLWRHDGLEQGRALDSGRGRVEEVAFSADERQVLTLADDGALRVWLTGEARPPLMLREGSARLHSAVFSPDGRSVVAASDDGTVRRWSTQAASRSVVLGRHRATISQVLFSPDGCCVVSTSDDGTARIWRSDGAGPPLVLRHDAGVVTAAFSADGRFLLTASRDATARLWRADGTLVRVLRQRAPIWRVSLSADGSELATASEDDTVRVWPRDDPTHAAVEIHADDGSSVTAAFSPDGSKVLTASDDGIARVWSADGAGVPIELVGHEGALYDAEFSSDGRRVVTASADATARVWNANGLGKPVVLRGHDAVVQTAKFSSDGLKVITASDDNAVRIFNADGSGVPVVLRGHGSLDQAFRDMFESTAVEGVLSARLSRDGQRAFSVGMDGRILIWSSTGAGAPVILPDRMPLLSLALSPDDTKIAAIGLDGAIHVWNSDGSGALISLPGHNGMLTDVDFDASGSRIATASSDGTARLWNASGVGDPLVLAGSDASVNSVEISPDGHALLTASDDGTARLWSIDETDLRRRLWAMTADCLPTSRRLELFAESPAQAGEGRQRCLQDARRAGTPRAAADAARGW